MEMLLYQSTQFRDVKKILDRAHGFAGLLTAGGIEAGCALRLRSEGALAV